MTAALRLVLGWGLTAFLAYPMLFYAHKYAVPWISSMIDFRSYHTMVLHPLDFGIVRAPFAMRQMTAVVASGILKLGLVYPNQVSFDSVLTFRNVTYRPDVFFALILANFLGVVSAGAFVYASVARKIASPGQALSLPACLAVCLLLLSGSTLFHAVAPMMEGWSWFLAAFGFHYYRRSDGLAYLALAVLPLAVFQRELLPLVFAGLPAAELLSRRRTLDPRRRRFLVTLGVASVVAVFGYYLLRKDILPVAATDLHQISPSAWWSTLTRRLVNPAGLGTVLKVLLKLNLVFLWGALAVAAARRGLKGWDRHMMYALAAVAASFTLLALSTGAELSSDRYISIMMPIFAVLSVELLLLLTRADGEAASDGDDPHSPTPISSAAFSRLPSGS